MPLSKNGTGYAWKLESGEICHWCEPEKAVLLKRGKPSSNAKIIKVQIVPYGSIGRRINKVSKITTHNTARQVPQGSTQICPACKNNAVIYSFKHGEYMCENCGEAWSGKLLPC